MFIDTVPQPRTLMINHRPKVFNENDDITLVSLRSTPLSPMRWRGG